jgi:hypothetical protein
VNTQATAYAIPGSRSPIRRVVYARNGEEVTTPIVLEQLRSMSVRGLNRMFDPRQRLFVFRLQQTPDGIRPDGHSVRYTAISLLGMAHLDESVDRAILGMLPKKDVCVELARRVAESPNLGDVALSLWAATRNGLADSDIEPVIRRLKALRPGELPHPTVEVAWALSALSTIDRADIGPFREKVARRLMDAFGRKSRLFPHLLGSTRTGGSHVACFADLIYPIQALAKFAARTRHAQALDIASACAERLCSLQGYSGQWWWHYDYRSGDVIEGYPVYAIHQDAMGPMGLFALRDAGGADCSKYVNRGMDWLVSAPELQGGSLIDTKADLIWRKVARREPRKGVRYMQAALSRVHPSLRVPAVDNLFPPGVIDYEDRPYHLGWLLYAWRFHTGRTTES